ncbi:MAG: nucleotide-binding protein [Clostridia bacterium]|nr:nucleotide-binding protein [Clostridia bacterium]
MDSIFIGWSGNKELAQALAAKFKDSGKYQAIVGGGTPSNMYLGAQVIEQINGCDSAILLVENKTVEGHEFISPNLMFEWGYLVSHLSAKKINTVLINISKSSIPSDVLGTWLEEKTLDRTVEGAEEKFVQEVYESFEKRYEEEIEFSYFDIINDWKNCFPEIKNQNTSTDREMCCYIIFGCLAAYYYGDNEDLKRAVSLLSCTDDTVRTVVLFAKSYIDVFLDSKNMMVPLTDAQVFKVDKTFNSVLKKKRSLSKKLDDFLDILCYDAKGLAYSLFLRNDGLDDEIKEFADSEARKSMETVLTLLSTFEKDFTDNNCIVLLIKSYIYNDSAKHYSRLGDEEKYLYYLDLAVESRQKLFEAVETQYPENQYLIEKMEQEYVIAFSDMCRHETNPIAKRSNLTYIKDKLGDWKSDLDSLCSLVTRIENNLSKIG